MKLVRVPQKSVTTSLDRDESVRSLVVIDLGELSPSFRDESLGESHGAVTSWKLSLVRDLKDYETEYPMYYQTRY